LLASAIAVPIVDSAAAKRGQFFEGEAAKDALPPARDELPCRVESSIEECFLLDWHPAQVAKDSGRERVEDV